MRPALSRRSGRGEQGDSETAISLLMRYKWYQISRLTMRRLILSTDYALRTLLYLASHPDRQVSTREVVQFYGISADHVSKVVQHLAHAGYVRARRGRGGRLRLGGPLPRSPWGAWWSPSRVW